MAFMPAQTLWTQPAGACAAVNPMMPVAPASGSGHEMHQVLAAIGSLYQDQVEPLGRILCKRLSERVPNVAHMDAKRVRAICETCPWVQIENKHGADWCALIRGRERNFVDVYSPEDRYHQEFWAAAAAYFEGLDDVDMVLPGGRYSCAQTLVSRSLPFLAGLTLGQVSHIVQLAISKKRILGYLNGAVVPYGRSQSKVKDTAAEHGTQVRNSSFSKGVKLADWKSLIEGLQDILADVNSNGIVPLSNIKRMFRSRFQVDVSETALGHAKLSELFQDSRFLQTCAVRQDESGYVVTKPTPPTAKHIALDPALPQRPPASAQSQGRDPSVKVALVSEAVAGANAVAALLHVPKISHSNPEHYPAADPSQSARCLQARAHRVKPLEFADAGPSADDPMPVMTPTPCSNGKILHHSMPLNALEWENSCRAIGLVPPTQGAQRQAPRDASDAKADSQSFQSENLVSERCMLTPGMLENMGCCVQNTFIHSKAAPPTPSFSAAARSHSLPRNTRTAKSTESVAASTFQQKVPDEEKQGRPANRLMSAAAAAAAASADDSSL